MLGAQRGSDTMGNCTHNLAGPEKPRRDQSAEGGFPEEDACDLELQGEQNGAEADGEGGEEKIRRMVGQVAD